MGAYSRLGTLSNEYGTYVYTPIQRQEFKEGNLHRTISAHIITQTNNIIMNRISNVVLFVTLFRQKKKKTPLIFKARF